MKKNILLIACILFSLGSIAQINFSDNFDSYAVNAYLGPQSPNWTTWSGIQGGADDIFVTNVDAHSGANSLYFTSTATSGGPADIVLPFGGPHTKGNFTFTTWFKIVNGKGGYFNFQGNNTIGNLFTLNTFFAPNGDLSITNTKGQAIATTYPQGTWFEFKFVADLNTNSWDLLINGVSKGTFQCADFTIASIDYYATGPTDAFYVDDVAFTYAPFTLPSVNAAMGYLDIANGLVGQQRESALIVRNLGVSPITSFSVKMDANGTQSTQNFTGVNIASGATYAATLTNPVTLVAGVNTFIATVNNVNGSLNDGFAGDDSKTLKLIPAQPGKDKVVVAEEATGTWCQWCPRGAVALAKMTKDFPGYFQGIAVHNGDPMVLAAYDTGLGTIINGYPSAVVDRLPDIDPSAIEGDFMKRIVLEPVATMKNGAVLNATNDLFISVKTTFNTAASGNYKIACVIVEDSVKGTGSGYNQSNAYAGGASGPMGGYENLPASVPAAQMQYDHVARAIAPSFLGLSNAYPASVAANSDYSHAFMFNIAPWNKNKLHIISMIIAPDGKIENAKASTIAEAVANGYSMPTGINEQIIKPTFASVYPNPTQGNMSLQINSKSASTADVLIIDVNGKLLMKSNQKIASGTNIVPMVLGGIAKGNYVVLVTMDNQTQSIPFVLD